MEMRILYDAIREYNHNHVTNTPITLDHLEDILKIAARKQDDKRLQQLKERMEDLDDYSGGSGYDGW